jgi:hypothetical protein
LEITHFAKNQFVKKTIKMIKLQISPVGGGGKRVKAGVLKLFCIATLSKHFQNFCDPKMLQTTANLR